MRFEFMYERLFTNEFVCRRFEVASQNNTSQIIKRMVWLVEINSHRETPAVVSDTLFMIIQSKSRNRHARMHIYMHMKFFKPRLWPSSTTKAQLIDRNKAVFETLPRESATSACSMLRGKIEAVIDANDGYFE